METKELNHKDMPDRKEGKDVMASAVFFAVIIHAMMVYFQGA